jgi:hypothetical protein
VARATPARKALQQFSDHHEAPLHLLALSHTDGEDFSQSHHSSAHYVMNLLTPLGVSCTREDEHIIRASKVVQIINKEEAVMPLPAKAKPREVEHLLQSEVVPFVTAGDNPFKLGGVGFVLVLENRASIT